MDHGRGWVYPRGFHDGLASHENDCITGWEGEKGEGERV